MTTSPALALAVALFAATPAPAPAPGAPQRATRRAPASRRSARGPSRRATSPRCCRRSSNAATARTRDIDRARCQATTAYLRQTLPRRTFAFTTDEPAVVAVSDYDAAVKGYHVALAGCVACSKPDHDRQGEGAAPDHAEGPRQGRRLADEGGLALAQHVRVRQPRRRQALGRRRATVPARRVPLPAADRRRRLDVRHQPRRRAEAGRRARLQPLHGRRAGVEAAVDGLGRTPVARPRGRDLQGPADRGERDASPRRRPRARICRPS